MAKGIVFQPQPSNPLPPSTQGLWINAGGDLIYQTSAPINITQAVQAAASGYLGDTQMNQSGVDILHITPVRMSPAGSITIIDASIENHAFGTIGVTVGDILNGHSGIVVYMGRVADISTSAGYGSALFVSKTGGLTSTKPSNGIGGFNSGDWVIRIGTVIPSILTPGQKDLLVNVQLVGQL